MTIGELRRSEGNLVGAVAAFSTALQRLSSSGADALAVARAAVELAVTLAQGSDAQAADDALRRAQELAREADAPYLEARTAGCARRAPRAHGERGCAEIHLRSACEAALARRRRRGLRALRARARARRDRGHRARAPELALERLRQARARRSPRSAACSASCIVAPCFAPARCRMSRLLAGAAARVRRRSRLRRARRVSHRARTRCFAARSSAATATRASPRSSARALPRTRAWS